jgi:hypothetical protein
MTALSLSSAPARRPLKVLAGIAALALLLLAGKALIA